MFGPIVRALYRIEVVGRENIPKGGIILAANHTAFSDVLVISAAANRQVRYMAKKELFRIPGLKQLITALGAYPVDRGGADIASIKRTIALLSEGELIGIFPQGTRHGGEDPRTTEVKGGVGMIAYHAKAPILPVFVCNKRMKTGILRRNTVIFGQVIPFSDLGLDHGGAKAYEACARLVFRHVCALKYGESELPPPGEKPSIEAPSEEGPSVGGKEGQES